MRLFVTLLLGIVYFSLPNNSFAQVPELPTVSVINEIRGPQLGLENANLLESLQGQWKVTKEKNITATWLWQYSALEDTDLTTFAKNEMADQEFGIFLEIDKNTAEKAGLTYKGRGPWYHSDGLLLVSYDQADRRKLIDMIFKKFKDEFGYYPKSVGAWWVGADAIRYMHEKYGVIAVLQCADQFNTDAYSLWGTPWSIPYIPSKSNAAIPAQNYFDKQDNVVIMQWATRDPLRAYGDSVKDSTYSVQDMNFVEIAYYEYLSFIFLKEPFDQTVIGLEGGLPPHFYEPMYKKQLQAITEWEKENKVITQTSEEYAQSFLARGQALPPTKYFLTTDYKTTDQSFWYHSPYYRVGIQKRGDTIYLSDYRNYKDTASEDFSILPNTQSLIRIHTNAQIDSIRFLEQEIVLENGNEPLQIQENNDSVKLISNGKEIAIFSSNTVDFLTLPDRKDISNHYSELFSIPGNLKVVIVIIAGYILYLWKMAKQKKQKVIAYATLALSIILLFPVISNGAFISDQYLFSSRFTQLLSIFSILPLSPEIKIFLTYQIFPLVLAFGIHLLLLKYCHSIKLFVTVYLALSIFITFYYADFHQMFSTLLIVGKKQIALNILGSIFTIVALWAYVKVYTVRTTQTLLIGAGSLLLFLLMLYSQVFLLDKRVVITPFEMEALNEIQNNDKDVLYFTTKHTVPHEEYKDVFPVAFIDAQMMEWLTGLSWVEVPRKDKDAIEAIYTDNRQVAIPKYQGAFIYEHEAIEYGLKKTFDNAQIAIYEE